MNLGIAAAALVLPVAGGIPLVWQHRRRRDRVYARLSAEQASFRKRVAIEFSRGDYPSEARSLASAFVAERLVRIRDFLAPATLACLRDGALAGIALGLLQHLALTQAAKVWSGYHGSLLSG